jgi:hypothetical protein
MLAATIGAYVALAPDDGSLTFLWSTWTTAELVDTWAPWLLIVGGAVAAVGMTVSAISDMKRDGSKWLIGAEMVLVVGGIAAVAWGIVILV